MYAQQNVRMHSHARIARMRGFTLIELLVTIAIVAIMAALAAPSFRDFIVRKNLESITSEFSSDIALARSRAINGNLCVTMCVSSSAAGAAPLCTGGSDWQVGWIVFLNPTCNSGLSKPQDAGDLLRARVSKEGEYYLNSQQGATSKMTFNPRGSPGLSNASEYDAVYMSSNNPLTLRYAKNICVDALGRTRAIPSESSCSNYK